MQVQTQSSQPQAPPGGGDGAGDLVDFGQNEAPAAAAPTTTQQSMPSQAQIHAPPQQGGNAQQASLHEAPITNHGDLQQPLQPGRLEQAAPPPAPVSGGSTLVREDTQSKEMDNFVDASEGTQ